MFYVTLRTRPAHHVPVSRESKETNVKKLIPLLILSGSVIFSSSIGNLRADEAAAAAAAQKDLKSAIIGTWRAVSMKVDNRTIDLPDSQPRLKHVTPDGFTWL